MSLGQLPGAWPSSALQALWVASWCVGSFTAFPGYGIESQLRLDHGTSESTLRLVDDAIECGVGDAADRIRWTFLSPDWAESA